LFVEELTDLKAFLRAGVFLTALLMVTLSLSSCSAPPSIGALVEREGGIQIIVPALWADSGSGKSGIEPATIWVDDSRNESQPSYDVNLSDVQSKGGGAMWQAATSAAAAVGTLFSGVVPDDIALRFDITGPIDGPSAGGILTVGVLAALNEHPMDSSTTMTGTISPDGSIGPVGLIGLKLQAAAEEGYTRVLVPAALTEISDPETGEPISTQRFASSVGVDITFVRTIEEAYEAFTGESLLATSGAPVFNISDYPKLDLAQEGASRQLYADVEKRLSEFTEAPQPVRDQLTASERARESGDVTTAFALAVDALNLLERWHGEATISELVRDVGPNEARLALKASVMAEYDTINSQLKDQLGRAESFTPAQSLAFPAAVAWLTYARAIFVSMDDALANPAIIENPELLTSYGALAAQVAAESKFVFPASMQVLDAVPKASVKQDQPVNIFMSGYTNFLITAGDANLTYLQDVIGLSEQDELYVTDLAPVAFALADDVQTIDPATQSLAEEMEESSVAMTYFVVTTSLVTGVQVFGSADMWLDAEQAQTGGNEYVLGAIMQSNDVISQYADRLLDTGLNAGFPVWSAQWGTAAFDELSGQNRETAGASIALNELWYDVITVLAMNAYAGQTNK
jgi:Lon protease (S16) C-terminal proteolytic domain